MYTNTLIRPIVVYAMMTLGHFRKTNELRLSVFERNVLRRTRGTQLGIKDMLRNQMKFFRGRILYLKKRITPGRVLG